MPLYHNRTLKMYLSPSTHMHKRGDIPKHPTQKLSSMQPRNDVQELDGSKSYNDNQDKKGVCVAEEIITSSYVSSILTNKFSEQTTQWTVVSDCAFLFTVYRTCNGCRYNSAHLCWFLLSSNQKTEMAHGQQDLSRLD